MFGQRLLVTSHPAWHRARPSDTADGRSRSVRRDCFCPWMRQARRLSGHDLNRHGTQINQKDTQALSPDSCRSVTLTHDQPNQ